MMKTKHISLSLTLLLITNFAIGQYSGGDGDGSNRFTTSLSYPDGSMISDLFQGGNGDGYSSDGDSLIYLDGSPAFTYLMGGNGSGADVFSALDYYVDGTTLGDSYGGGNGDGANADFLSLQFLEGSRLEAAFGGGDGDGFDNDMISPRFLDGATGCAIYSLVAGKTDSVNNGTYSQRITVFYAFDPEVGDLIVNNQSFPITGSPQLVILTGLSPDGMPVDVTASFSALPNCKNTEFALFIAPDTTGSASIYTELGAPEVRFSSRPNPFSSQITFSVQMDKPEFISMDLMTFNGQKVATIYEGKINGKQTEEITYHARNLPQGMYLCRLQANGHVYYQKLVKLK
jgi:hypothetical protein